MTGVKKQNKRKSKYQISFSKVYPDVSLAGFTLPDISEVESVGAVFKAVRSYLLSAYGEKYPKAFTQAAVAEYMGYSTSQYIYIVERGEVEPALNLCAKFCDYYGIPANYMYDLLMEVTARKIKTVLCEKHKDQNGV